MYTLRTSCNNPAYTTKVYEAQDNSIHAEAIKSSRLTFSAASSSTRIARLTCLRSCSLQNDITCRQIGGIDGSVTGSSGSNRSGTSQHSTAQPANQARTIHGVHGVCHPSKPSSSASGVPWRRPGLDNLHTVFFSHPALHSFWPSPWLAIHSSPFLPRTVFGPRMAIR